MLTRKIPKGGRRGRVSGEIMRIHIHDVQTRLGKALTRQIPTNV